ncbi:MAG: hypothetical protein J6V52_01500 [Bacteroidaceae bacterium]|nr:hypothetical protein [Bacteroidaceae bacterium]
MKNRAQRRAEYFSTPSYKRMSREDKIKAFYKNGITVDDLERNYRLGYEAGWRESQEPHMRTCYAAALIAYRRATNATLDQCVDFLQTLDDQVTNTITSDEAADRAFAETGIQFDFAGVFASDRVTALEGST